jgi:hypothetical protein
VSGPVVVCFDDLLCEVQWLFVFMIWCERSSGCLCSMIWCERSSGCLFWWFDVRGPVVVCFDDIDLRGPVIVCFDDLMWEVQWFLFCWFDVRGPVVVCVQWFDVRGPVVVCCDDIDGIIYTFFSKTTSHLKSLKTRKTLIYANKNPGLVESRHLHLI